MTNLEIEFYIGRHKPWQKINQKVDYFYAFNEKQNQTGQREYDEISSDNHEIIALNYIDYSNFVPNFGAPVGISSQGKRGWDNYSVYKREIWENGGESFYHPVVKNTGSKFVIDHNVANNRTYEYVMYPYSSENPGTQPEEYHAIVNTKWDFWSLTELYPTEDKNKYIASSDTWLFKYNVQPSEQVQNLSKTQQDNLGRYPVFSYGRKNNISSSITAFLGSEMAPYNWSFKKKVPIIEKKEEGQVKTASIVWKEKLLSEGYSEGGYKETVPWESRLSSNEKIDMLNHWRKICYSGNPKLIKDLKGQKFLVQIIDSSNQSNDSWNGIPDQITFSWVEIGSLDNVEIYETLGEQDGTKL